MIRDFEAGAVVVGVDGNSADDALDWAAAEAATRGCPLIVVHAFHPRFLVDLCSLLPVSEGAVTIPPEAEQVLGRAVNRARSVASELEVLAQLTPGAPAEVMLDQSRQASLLVLGGRRPHALQCLGAPSVSGRVVLGACCPVVVVRERGQVRSGTSRPRVVVGVDAAGSSAAAIGFAFHAAAQRAIPVSAVHAWHDEAPGDVEAMNGDFTADESTARAALDRILMPWRALFPDVPVRAVLRYADPETALTAESVGAALVVVGSRGRGVLRGRLFGLVSRAVVQRAHCAVAVVRPDGAVAPRAAQRRRRASRTTDVASGARLHGD